MKVRRIEKLTIREDTGCLTIEDPGNNHNFALASGVFVKNSSDGRGSSVESIGGNPSGFSELDDLYYFARKLYRALKYPLSRVSAGQEKREADIMFGGNNTAEISRDEIKWAKFLERQQNKFCREFLDLFLLHLEFKGMKKQYSLDNKSFNITMNSPSHYKQQMDQMFVETEFNNYTTMADREEFSKYFLVKKYLHWDDEDMKANKNGFAKDKTFKLTATEEEGDEGKGEGKGEEGGGGKEVSDNEQS